MTEPDQLVVRVQVSIEDAPQNYRGNRMNVTDEFRLSPRSFLGVAQVLGQFHELADRIEANEAKARSVAMEAEETEANALAVGDDPGYDSARGVAPHPLWSSRDQLAWYAAATHVLLLNASENCRRHAAEAGDQAVGRPPS